MIKMGRGQGHVINFLNFGTLCIIFERVKVEIIFI